MNEAMANTSKTALVTGATGFVGSHLAHRLVAEGWRVHIIIRPTSSLVNLQRIVDSLEVHCHDGSMESLQHIIAAAKPAMVFHLASLFLGQHTPEDITPLVTNNINFGTQLVEAMVQNRSYCLVNSGTSWQHYQNSEYSPVCLYAATKRAFEAILQFYWETTPLKAITLKLFDTYGPYDHRKKLFNLLRETAKQQVPLAMSPGEQLIDLVHIDDVIEAYLLAAKRLLDQGVADHETYAVSSGAPVPLKKLVEIYAQETQTTIPIQWGERPYRSREVMIPWNQGQVLPNWRPQVDLRKGIRHMEKE